MHAVSVIVGVSLLLASLVRAVHAAEPPPILPEATLAEVCAEQGVFAGEVARMRDEGIPEKTVLADVQHTGNEVMAGVDVAVQDAVVARLLALVREIYADPQRSPEQAKGRAELDCLKTAVPH